MIVLTIIIKKSKGVDAIPRIGFSSAADLYLRRTGSVMSGILSTPFLFRGDNTYALTMAQ